MTVTKLSMKSKLPESLHTCTSYSSVTDVVWHLRVSTVACPSRRCQMLMIPFEKRVKRYRDFDFRSNSRMNRFPRVWSEHNLIPPLS